MRVAVISDIHGELDSLRRVLTAIDRAAIDQIWCLGDIVGLGATAPSEVVDLDRDRCALALAGNHDRWVTGQLSLSMLPLPRQRAQLQWQARIGLVGHTHRPLIAEHNGTTIDYDENPDGHDLADDHRAVLNPRAVLGSRRWLELDLAARHAIWQTA